MRFYHGIFELNEMKKNRIYSILCIQYGHEIKYGLYIGLMDKLEKVWKKKKIKKFWYIILKLK